MDKEEATAKQSQPNKIYTVFSQLDIPEATEKYDKRKGIVTWGDDNLYPQFLWYLYYTSPIHQGIVNTKIDYISSGGLSYSGTDEEFNKINENDQSDYTLTEVVEMVTVDNEISNCYYLLARKNSITKYWCIETIDFEKVRPNEDNTVFKYSDDWSKTRQSEKETGYKEYKSYFTVDHLIRSGDETITECVMQVKQKSRQYRLADQKKVTGGFFSIPVYSGGIDSILTDIEINVFRLSEVVNGYMGGALVNFPNGIPESDAEAEKIIKKSRLEATNRYKRGQLAISFSDGVDAKPTVDMINGNNLHERYQSTEVGLAKKIMIAHSVTNPKLFGVMAENVMSETNDKESFDRFQKTYASKRRAGIADSINFLLRELNGVTGKIEINVPTLVMETGSDQSQKTLEALNSLSPLVATKVLDTMTPNQVLGLIGLPSVQGGDVIPAPAQFSIRDILGHFAACGRDKEGVVFIHSREMKSFDADDGDEYMKSVFKDRFATVTDMQRKIITGINDGAEYQQLADSLKLTPGKLSKELTALRELGYVKKGEALGLTHKGQIEATEVTSVEVVYTYEERPDAPPLVPGGESRDFCRTMLRLNRVYTRQEIDSISTAVGRNVWLYRGGWYHDPRTDKNQPSCRHYWRQSVVLKR